MSFSSSNSAAAIGLASHPPPVYSWSAHSTPPSARPLFPRYGHSTTAAAAGELFLFGGCAHDHTRNDLYVFSTRDFSITQPGSKGETPGPRYGHGVALSGTLLLVWGGWTNFGGKYVQNKGHDDSLYLLNLGMSDLLISRPAPADQSFLPSSVAKVDPRHGQWSRALRSFLPFRDFGWFQSLRLRWQDP